MKYNDTIVSITIHTGSVTYNTSYQELGAEILKDTTRNIDLRPTMPVSYINQDGKCIHLKDNSYKVGFFKLSGTGTSGAYAQFTYPRR